MSVSGAKQALDTLFCGTIAFSPHPDASDEEFSRWLKVALGAIKEKSNAGDWNGEDALKAANLAFTAFVDRFSTDTSSWPSCTAPLLAEALDHAFANSHWETIAATIDARQEEVPMDAAEGDTPDDLDNVVGLSQEQRLLIRATRIERKPLVDEVEFLSRRIEKLDRTKAQIVYDIRQARKRPPQERNAAIAAVEARWGEDA